MKLSTLPRSVRGALTEFRFRGGRPVFNDPGIRPEQSQAMMHPGVRSGAWQGTSSQGNTPDPLHPGRPVSTPPAWDDETEMPSLAYFDPNETPSYDNTERATSQTKDWPPNPSRSITNHPSTAKEVLRTDANLQAGPPPGRIARFMPLRVFGYANGMLSGQHGSEGFPWNADKDFIEHIPVPRKALETKGPQKLSDDNVTIPAIFAGNPRP